jgi:uncharacterized protein Yka (UPF0111/DUF47 family)
MFSVQRLGAMDKKFKKFAAQIRRINANLKILAAHLKAYFAHRNALVELADNEADVDADAQG